MPQRLFNMTAKLGSDLPKRSAVYHEESQQLAKDENVAKEQREAQLKFLYIYRSRRLKVKKKHISFADFAHLP